MKSQVVNLIKTFLILLVRWAPVLWRGNLYFWPAFLTPIAGVTVPMLKQDKWPSLPLWLAGVILGFIQGFITLRAFSDGSVDRHAKSLHHIDDLKRQSDTQFIKQTKT